MRRRARRNEIGSRTARRLRSGQPASREPPIPGLAEHADSMSTRTAAAMRLNQHIAHLPAGASTVLVVGGGAGGHRGRRPRCRPSCALLHHLARASSWPTTRPHPAPTWAPKPCRSSRKRCRHWAWRCAAACRSRRSMPWARLWMTANESRRRPSCGAPACAPIRSPRPFPVERDRPGRLPVDPTLKIIKGDSPPSSRRATSRRFPIDGSIMDASSPASTDGQWGPLRRPQRGLRPAGREDAAAQHRLVHDHPRSRSWGGARSTPRAGERRLVSRAATAKRTKAAYKPRAHLSRRDRASRQAILDAAAPTVQTPPSEIRVRNDRCSTMPASATMDCRRIR